MECAGGFLYGEIWSICRRSKICFEERCTGLIEVRRSLQHLRIKAPLYSCRKLLVLIKIACLVEILMQVLKTSHNSLSVTR